MGPSMNDEVSSRFGRAPYFLLIDLDESSLLKSIENPNVQVGGGAGVQSAQTLADEGVNTVLTGNCGPRAFQVFGAAEIDIYTGASGAVEEAVTAFKAGQLKKAGSANVNSHHGI